MPMDNVYDIAVAHFLSLFVSKFHLIFILKLKMRRQTRRKIESKRKTIKKKTVWNRNMWLLIISFEILVLFFFFHSVICFILCDATGKITQELCNKMCYCHSISFYVIQYRAGETNNRQTYTKKKKTGNTTLFACYCVYCTCLCLFMFAFVLLKNTKWECEWEWEYNKKNIFFFSLSLVLSHIRWNVKLLFKNWGILLLLLFVFWMYLFVSYVLFSEIVVTER